MNEVDYLLDIPGIFLSIVLYLFEHFHLLEVQTRIVFFELIEQRYGPPLKIFIKVKLHHSGLDQQILKEKCDRKRSYTIDLG